MAHKGKIEHGFKFTLNNNVVGMNPQPTTPTMTSWR